MLALDGKSVVVTGASSGIGWHLALILARKGARLALCARRRERLEDLQGKIVNGGGRTPLVASCDVSRWDQVRQLRDQVEAAWGPVDVLINNAGRGAFGPFEGAATADIDAVVNTNLLGPIYCTRAFLPGMLRDGRGNVVFISSVLGELPAPDHAVYGATKFALTGLAESLQYELADRGIKVTLVEPGLVHTEFAQVSGTPLERFKQMPSKTAAETARLAAGAIEREETYFVTDRIAKAGIDMRRHFPRMTRRVFGWALRRMGKREGGGELSE